MAQPHRISHQAVPPGVRAGGRGRIASLLRISRYLTNTVLKFFCIAIVAFFSSVIFWIMLFFLLIVFSIMKNEVAFEQKAAQRKI